MSQKRTLRIATRRSALALWQANMVAEIFKTRGFEVELVPIVTTGDKMQKGALSEVKVENSEQHLSTGKGLFVKEIQESLLANTADLAVHSMKDLPVHSTSGLATACILPRAHSSDVLVLCPAARESLAAQNRTTQVADSDFDDLKNSEAFRNISKFGKVGTVSARRQALINTLLPGAHCETLRGNVDSRLARVRAGEFAAILLARAGLDRLGLYVPGEMITLPVSVFTPAPAQGVVAIEIRSDDAELVAASAELNAHSSLPEILCERFALQCLGGDCHMAVAIHADQNSMHVWSEKNNRACSVDIPFGEAALPKWQAGKTFSTLAEEFKTGALAKHIRTSLRYAGFELVDVLPAGTPL